MCLWCYITLLIIFCLCSSYAKLRRDSFMVRVLKSIGMVLHEKQKDQIKTLTILLLAQSLISRKPRVFRIAKIRNSDPFKVVHHFITKRRMENSITLFAISNDISSLCRIWYAELYTTILAKVRASFITPTTRPTSQLCIKGNNTTSEKPGAWGIGPLFR